MWHRVLTYLVRRALPVELTTGAAEPVAVDAAECGIRYVGQLAAIAVVSFALLGVAVLGSMWLFPRPALPPADAVHLARDLGIQNAQLRVANRILEQERDALLARVTALEAQPLHAPARSLPPQPVPDTPAPPTSAPTPAEIPAALRPPVQSNRVAPDKAVAWERVQSLKALPVRCADGRTVSLPGQCSMPSPVPSSRLVDDAPPVHEDAPHPEVSAAAS